MKVSDLAKELSTSSDEILRALSTLKLKAKDSKQDLSPAAVTMVKNAVKRGSVTLKAAAVESKPAPAPKAEVKAEKAKKVVEPPKEKVVAKKPVEKPVEKKEALSQPKAAPAKPEEKKKLLKKVVKKEAPDAKKKPVKKLSSEPMIALKPLVRKRKKLSRDTPGFPRPEDGQAAAPTAGAEAAAPLADKTIESAIATAKLRKEAAQENLQAQAAAPVEWVRDASLPDLEIKVPISVKDLSNKLDQRPSDILKTLMQFGVFANINQGLDGDIVNRLAQKFGFNAVKIKTQEEQLIESHEAEKEDESLKSQRAPVITFMGHVDHGKTTLIDYIRKSKVADHEHGGITQHVGAYSVNMNKGRITVLDTPGHEAFTAMRARGAHITDIVVLVVAADEGVMPQTEEAIDHARAAEVPIVVALTKIDKPNADADRVKKQLTEYDLAAEDWGGKTVVAGVSGVTGEGVTSLLEMILLESEMLELKANPDKRASGIVVDAHMSQGKGALATLIVQSGTLKEGDIVVVGPFYGKIKAMYSDLGKTIKSAGPSMPVEVLGIPHVPEAGDEFYVVSDERQAKEISEVRQAKLKDKRLAHSKVTLEDLYAKLQDGSVKELNVVLKADVQGSLEALKDALTKIPSSKVKIKFIHAAVGEVNNSDVLLAVASKAIIIAFHVGIGPNAKKELDKDIVDVRQYRIIYDAVDDMKKALEGMLDIKTKKHFTCRIEIREVFKLSKQGIVAGCYVTKGRLPRKTKVDVLRDSAIVFSGSISSLKRFKDDVREVNEGMECGIQIEGFTDYQPGDIIEAFTEEKIAQKL